MTQRRVLVLRHAKSSWSDPRLGDYDRPLAPRGRRAAGLMGLYLGDEKLVPDLVLCSGAMRARETWICAAHCLSTPPKAQYEKDLYMAPSVQIFRRLAGLADVVLSVLVVGHETSVDVFATKLIGAGDAAARRRMAEKFPTAALAVIALDLPHWNEIGERRGTLTRFVTPKDLV